MQLRPALFFIALSAFAVTPLPALSQFSPAPVSATAIPAAQLLQPADLIPLLKSGPKAPLVLQVGSRLFFAEGHIPGSQYAGQGSQASGLQLLENTVASVPKGRLIVLYCGCCPWNHCPNVGPPFRRLRELGFTNVKVLYLANNFGDDWVNKGYPTARQ